MKREKEMMGRKWHPHDSQVKSEWVRERGGMESGFLLGDVLCVCVCVCVCVCF